MLPKIKRAQMIRGATEATALEVQSSARANYAGDVAHEVMRERHVTWILMM